MPPTRLEEVQRLGLGLKLLIRARGATGKAVARRLGVHPGHLARVFGGRRPLHVEQVFRILEAVNVAPWDFFSMMYRLGAEPAQLSRRWSETEPGPPPRNTREVFGELARRTGLDKSALFFTAKAGRVLRAGIARQGLTQRHVARQIGMPSDGLGEILRGKVRMNFQHVFPVLEVLGWTPARFFLDVFATEPADPVQALSQSQLFDDLEGILSRVGTRAG